MHGDEGHRKTAASGLRPVLETRRPFMFIICRSQILPAGRPSVGAKARPGGGIATRAGRLAGGAFRGSAAPHVPASPENCTCGINPYPIGSDAMRSDS